MTQAPFVDHYETLQLSPNASHDLVERVYRILAKRYHPDNQTTGDIERFSEVQSAYQTLSDPERRTQYDVHYDANRSQQWQIFDQQSAGDDREQDRRIFHGILSLLYVQRRRDPQNGGMGIVTLEKMLGCPQEHLEFPIWYLKRRGLIEVINNGQLAITVDGIDKLASETLSLPANRLLNAPSGTAPASDAPAKDEEGRPAKAMLATSALQGN